MRIKSRNTGFFGILIYVLMIGLSYGNDLYLSSDIPFEQNSIKLEERDILVYESPFFWLYHSGDGLGIPPGVNIDAYGLGGTYPLFSFDIPANLSNQAYSEKDIIRYNGTGFSLFLAGADIGIPDGVDIDGLCETPDSGMLFSIDVPAIIGGLAVQPNDIVYFDHVSVSIYVAGIDMGLPKEANIDGLWVSPDGNVLFSLDIPVNLGGMRIAENDIFQWNGVEITKYFDGAGAGLPPGVDINALALIPENYCEGDFDNDGDVDGADLYKLAQDFGREDCGGDCYGDFDWDGDVDNADLIKFAVDFGRNDCP